MTAQKDHYKVLGLEKKATEDDVKRAYRSLAKQFHPDKNKNPGAEEKFKEIGAAYDVLKDEQKRRTYDMERDTEQLRKDNEKASRERAEKAAREAREAAARASTKPTSWQTPPHRTPPHYDPNAFRNSAFFKDTSYEESRTKPPKGPKASTKSQRQYRGSEENKAPKYTFMKDEDASPRGPGAAGRRGTKAGGAGRQRAWQKTSFTTDFNMKPDWDDDFASDPTPSPTSPPPASTPRQTSSRRQKPQKPAGGNTYFHFVDDDLLNAAFEDFADILGEEPAEFVFPAFPSSNPLRHMFTTSNLDFYSNPNASRRQQPGKSKGDLDDDMWDWSKPMFGGSPDPKKAARMYGRRGSGASTPGGEMRCSYCRRPLPAAEVAGHEEICRRFHATPSPSPGGGIRGAAAPRNRAPPPRTRKSVEETSGCSDCQKKYGKNAKFHCSCGAKRAL